VEYAYWNLYGAYWTLFAREQALRQGFEAWRISKARLDAGTITLADLAQTRGQYELFRGQRLSALDDVLEKERQLRALMGMPAEDSTRLVPSDSPTLAKFEPDWDTALDEALTLRPEIYISRQEVKAKQMDLILAKNALMPDLRFLSSYDSNSIGWPRRQQCT
jgi:outer membrane protein TolC